MDGVDEIATVAETVKIALFGECENKAVSREGYDQVVRLWIGGGPVVEGDEEVKYAWLKRGEDLVDCTTDWMVGVDEKLPKSGLALTT